MVLQAVDINTKFVDFLSLRMTLSNKNWIVCTEVTSSGANIATVVTIAHPGLAELNSCTVTNRSVTKSNNAMYSRRYSIRMIRLTFWKPGYIWSIKFLRLLEFFLDSGWINSGCSCEGLLIILAYFREEQFRVKYSAGDPYGARFHASSSWQMTLSLTFLTTSFGIVNAVSYTHLTLPTICSV